MQAGQARATDLNEISRQVVDAAVKIHKQMGPGLLESVYRECLIHELQKRGFRVEAEVQVPIVYDGVALKSALCLDLLIENAVIIEVKSVEAILAVHRGQLLSYLKLTDRRLGLLINFNVASIKDGLCRLLHKF